MLMLQDLKFCSAFLLGYIDHALEKGVKGFLSVEMSAGQMVEDVKLSVSGRCPVHFYGRTGGGIPSPKDIIRKITEVMFVKEETTCAT